MEKYRSGSSVCWNARRVIRLTNVSAGYAEGNILSHIELQVARGERVCLLGRSGAGKTTLLRLMSAALAPRTGILLLDNHDPHVLVGAALRRMRSTIAIIHQSHDLVDRASVAHNVLAGRLGRWSAWETLRTWIWPAADRLSEVHGVLQRVGLGDYLWHRCDRLSGGQQQRVAIARALYQQAQVILADEPVASLDPANAAEVIDLLIRTTHEDGRTLVASLHQPELARRWFTRLIGVRDGAISFDLPAAEVDDTRIAALFAP